MSDQPATPGSPVPPEGSPQPPLDPQPPVGQAGPSYSAPGQPTYPGVGQSGYPEAGQPAPAYPGAAQPPYPGAAFSGQSGAPVPPAGAAKPSVAKRGAAGLIRNLIAIAVLLVLGVVGYLVFKPGVAGAKVGDCLTIAGNDTSAKADFLSCEDPNAAYVVTSTDGQCDSAESSYEVSKTGVQITKLCVWYNVKVGECLTDDSKGAAQKKPCESGLFRAEVVKDGTSDEKQCPDGTQALGDAKRNKLICFSEVP